MKLLYTAKATSTGGREGRSRTEDGRLDVGLSLPRELGGPGTPGTTNPEQLFAAGYSACFESAIRHIARSKKITINALSVTAEIGLHQTPSGGFALSANLKASMPETERATAEMLVAEAHKICPYSNATRNNIEVNVSVA